MRIDPTHALELVGQLRHDLAQIPRPEQRWLNPPPTAQDTCRAVRALRPRVKEIKALCGELGPGGMTLGEQALRDLMLAVIDEAREAGVRTELYPGQEEDERMVLGEAE